MKLFAGLLATLMAFPALAEKVGYIDMQKVIQATKAGKKAKETLDVEFKKRKDGLDKKKADIEKMGMDLEKKKTVLSEEVLGKKQMELQEEMMKFQKNVAENQTEIAKKEKDLLEPILNKMKTVIETVSKEKGFSMVLEKTGNNVVYAQKEMDISDDVIKAFEKEK